MSDLTETNISIKSKDDIKLEGKLLYPMSKSKVSLPLVILFPGSGPLNCDGNAPRIKLQLYDKIAKQISSRAKVATFRYNKRGVKPSTGNFEETTFWEFVDDAQAVTEHFSNGNNSHVDKHKIYLLGHSEGCFTVTALGARLCEKDMKLGGIIFVSGFGTSFEDMVQFQRDGIEEAFNNATGCLGCLNKTFDLKSKVVAQNIKVTKEIRESKEKVIKSKGQKFPAAWFRELLDFDVKLHAAKITCPTVVMSGTKDVQVPYKAIEKSKDLLVNSPKCEIYTLVDVNHILRDQPQNGTIMDIGKIYPRLAKQDVSQLVLDKILAFLAQ
ncbi:hypothetical protein MP638_006841 [Amoeboaphelidium occidentale]|nr:hypothetical protein MP638_006841 [Amoeboaphelidium occidentale]